MENQQVCVLIASFPYQSEALFESCTTDRDCTDPGAYCNRSFNLCVCNSTTHYVINLQFNAECEAKHGLDELCTNSTAESCLDVNAECQIVGQETSCRCKSGYSNSSGQCVIVCPPLSDGTNFTVSIESITEGGTATYTCITGYTVGDSSITTSTRTCTNGTWNGQEPNCTRVDCGALPSPASGTVNASPNTLYQATATYTCDDGYTITSGDSSRTCTASGTWSGSEPTCSRRDCGTLPSPASGTVNASPNTLYQATATYTCDEGYTITSGDSSRTCTASGTWSGSEPTCSRRGLLYSYKHHSYDSLDCGSLLSPASGTVNVNPDTLYQATATYTCDDGYTITSGDSSRTCTASGNWSGSAPTCPRRGCGGLSNITNGKVIISSTLYEATATYACNDGYNIASGDSNRVCTASGRWSGSEPTCTKKDCGPLTDPGNGSVDLSPDTLFEATATYSCDTGFDRVGSQTLTCTSSGSWSGNPPTCIRRDCGSLGSLTNGGISYYQDTKYLSIATYSCNTGYIITGTTSQTSYSRTCRENGWDGSVPTCSKRDCGNLNNPVNGQVTVFDSLYQGTARYICNTGYDITGTSSNILIVTCLASGSWSQTGVTCTIKDCGPLSNPTNGNVAYSQTTYKSVATYTCDTGYIVSGTVSDTTKTVTCTAAGSWSDTATCTIKDCGNLGSLTNGLISYYQDTKYLSIATYSCNTGYIITGTTSQTSSSRTCRENGWDGVVPTCSKRVADAPNDLDISNVQSRNFTVSWTRPNNTFGEHRGYVVQVRLLDDTCVQQLLIKCTGCTGTFDESTLENMCDQSKSTTEELSTQTISSTTPISRMFTELDPDVYYNVIVTVVNTEGRGRISNQTLQTDEEVPQRPKVVSISDLTATSCTVTWYIDGPRPGDTIYTVITDAASPVTHDNLHLKGFNNRTQDLTGLQEYWIYTVIIRAETSKGSVDSDPTTFITRAAAPGPVDNFNIILYPSNDRKITVEWKVPVLLERNSIIYRFFLYHNTTEDVDERVIELPKNVDDNFKYTQTFNVTPGRYYLFKIFAVNTDNQNGVETERIVMTPALVIQDGTTSATSNIAIIVVAVIVPIIVIAAIAAVVLVIYRRRSARQFNSSKSKEEVQSSKRNNRLVSGPAFSQPTEFTSNMTKKEVVEWLKSNDFDRYRTQFKDYTGHDLLKLSKDDLKSICGPADGIRMYNRLRESTTDNITPQEDQAYMDLDDTKRDGVPYENIEMDRTHMYSSLQHV